MKFLFELVCLATAASASIMHRRTDYPPPPPDPHECYNYTLWPQYKDWYPWCPKVDECDQMHWKCPCPPPEVKEVYVTKYQDKYVTVTCTETKYVPTYVEKYATKTETCTETKYVPTYVEKYVTKTETCTEYKYYTKTETCTEYKTVCDKNCKP